MYESYTAKTVFFNVKIFLYCFKLFCDYKDICILQIAAEMDEEASTEEGSIALGHIIFINIY